MSCKTLPNETIFVSQPRIDISFAMSIVRLTNNCPINWYETKTNV